MSKAKALQGAFEQTQKYVGAGRGAGGDQAVELTRDDLILRSLRSKRLEGWRQ